MRPDDHARAVRRGPRHAAPRRPLLGRVPAGRAIALAAMPTAVFLGLGLTPRPAIAEDDPADRWRPGPCAERSEEPEDEETADAGDAPEARGGEEAPGAGESAEPGGGPSPGPSAAERPGAGAGSDGAAGDAGSDGGGAAGSGEAEPSPSPSESHPWYDPLGLGDTLDDLLDPDDPEAGAGPGAEPSDGSGGAGSDSGAGPAGSGSAGGTGAGSGAASEKERRATEKAVRDAAEEAGATVEELDGRVRDTAGDPADEKPDAADGTAADADGKKPFPCPTADPGALANAAPEPGLPLLPDDPWRLESTRLTLQGLTYHGIVEVRTYGGKVKKVLKYTADDGVDIRDLHQTVVGPGRNTTHVRADKGSTSTIRDGTVTMYTEELRGSLFGLIPLTFSPESPPPLDLPFAFFTDVQVVQAGQFGGTLTVPGLRNTVE
ncbi:hypothetical protein [Streptomyces sp. B5E4]|uniref:hypothetical protein n=1 Tax=Streptomyces sp. B5E4 TaxID=3153568 RepID=UPI00325ECDAC